MKDVKFRGYDGGDWIYGMSVNHEYGNGCDNWRMIHSDGELDEWIHVMNVGQYTGMKDKTGTEIYSGDIVRAWSQGVQTTGEIKRRIDGLWMIYPAWQEGVQWSLSPYVNGYADVEIIGNIYDR